MNPDPPPPAAESPAAPLPHEGKDQEVLLIKGRCADCAHYDDCPRMRGENVCYNKKVPLPPSNPPIIQSP